MDTYFPWISAGPIVPNWKDDGTKIDPRHIAWLHIGWPASCYYSSRGPDTHESRRQQTRCPLILCQIMAFEKLALKKLLQGDKDIYRESSFHSLVSGRYNSNFKSIIFILQKISSVKLLWNCSHVNDTESHLWEVIIGAGNGLVPSGSKSIPGTMFTQNLYRHTASQGHNESKCLDFCMRIKHP